MKSTIDIGLRVAAILLLLAAMTACSTAGDDGGGGGGGDGDGNGGTTGTRDVGFLTVEEDEDVSQSTLTVRANGGFVRFDGDVPETFLNEPWGTDVGTCDVTTFTVGDPLEGIPRPEGLGMSFLEAGAAVDVTSDGTSYVTLARTEITINGETMVAYGSDDVDGPLEASLAADVPGDEFPAVANAAFPDVGAFALTAPASPGSTGSVDVDTTFQWSDASNDANTIVTIDLVGSDGSTFVACYAADTGSFDLPEATKTELGGAFTGRVDRAGRESIRVQAVGDARLLLNVSRAQTFVTTMIPFDDGERAR